MTPKKFLETIIDPGLLFLNELGGPVVGLSARVMMLAIALQESGQGLRARYQNHPSVIPGPARGWWQFEQGGGVIGVINHATTKALVIKVCTELEILVDAAAVWRSLEGHDILAANFARLLLFTDPRALTTTQQESYDYYIRNWRPGKPHPETWPANWQVANETCRALVA